MDKLISIIVPVYNAGNYFEDCIDSIINQTYKKLEIILVDDGSDDNCVSICDAYAEADNRISVIHKDNGGSTSARKTGLRCAKGEFIGFVDADDWIEHDYFEKMMQAQQKSEADIVVSNHFHDIGVDSGRICNNVPLGVYDRAQLLPQLVYSGEFFEYGVQPHLWSKIFKRGILEKIQTEIDDRIVIGEDAAVVYASILEADRICVSDICGYHYVQHAESITKKEQKNERDIYCLLFGHMERIFRDKNVWEIMKPQIEQYKKYLLFLRQMQWFDGMVLIPFGGIPKDSKVIIYGAGVMGQRMEGYLSGINGIRIVLWVDKNYINYQEKGMDVKDPKEIRRVKDYDYILVANTVQRTADVIRSYLVGIGVENKKIRWFSEEFINGR